MCFSGRICATRRRRPWRTSSPGPGWILSPSPHSPPRPPQSPSFRFFLALICFLLCTLSEYSPSSLFSSSLSLSRSQSFPFFSYVYLLVTPPAPHPPSSHLHTTHSYSTASFAAPPGPPQQYMYNISQLSQHEQRRTQCGMEVCRGKRGWIFRSVNIATLWFLRGTMSLLIMELFICLWCAVILY